MSKSPAEEYVEGYCKRYAELAEVIRKACTDVKLSFSVPSGPLGKLKTSELENMLRSMSVAHVMEVSIVREEESEVQEQE